jgi:hypothetical protein
MRVGTFGGRGADGVPGVDGLPGVDAGPAYLLTSVNAVQPLVGDTVEIRFSGSGVAPETGMKIASSGGLYRVLTETSSSIWEVELLEERGTPPGNIIPGGTKLWQAGEG